MTMCYKKDVWFGKKGGRGGEEDGWDRVQQNLKGTAKPKEEKKQERKGTPRRAEKGEKSHWICSLSSVRVGGKMLGGRKKHFRE